MSDQKLKKDGSIFEWEGRPSFGKTFPLAMQHVVAMIVGCVTPAIIVAGVAMGKGDMTAEGKVLLVQSALIIAALATFVQLFPIGKKVGSGLPVIMGVSFAYLASIQAIAAEYSMAAIFGAELVGGIVAVIVGIFIRKLTKFFPTLVTGTVVFTIGLSLYPTAINYMAGGKGADTYGSWQNWLVAIVTLVIVTILNHFGKGFIKLASILIGMIAGYLLAICFGMVDFGAVSQASWFQIVKPMHFGMEFEPAAIISVVILYVVNSVQAIGDLTATTEGGMDRSPTDKELSGGIIGNGVASILGAFIGGLPTATFSQNVGIVNTTKVVNRCVFGLAAVIILIAGIVPKFSSVLTTIPSCVLGGATVSVFASITMTGIKLICKNNLNYRNCSIVGLAVALGIGITQVPETLAAFPSWVTIIFGKSAVVVATIVAVFLNIIIPDKEEE